MINQIVSKKKMIHMSSWQSFFNQLSKPVNKEIILSSDKICSCNTGCLEFSSKSYISKGNCNLSSACCAIQIDKHRARIEGVYSTTIKHSEKLLSERESTPIVSLEAFLKR